MLDSFNRDIHYLRISVTDRCNLRCVYCMPEEGIPLKRHSDILSYEKIESIVRSAVKLGFSKIRLTGGEPLVRKNIEELVEKLAHIQGIKDLRMTTNGQLLKEKAGKLAFAGLKGINVSLDSLNPEHYKIITRIGSIEPVLEGIDAAKQAGLPVKINQVITVETSPDEISEMKAFCKQNAIAHQLIRYYALDRLKRDDAQFDRPPKCAFCNRIRLLSDGKMKPCLHSNQEIPVDFSDIESSIRTTVMQKPEAGLCCENRLMTEIGG